MNQEPIPITEQVWSNNTLPVVSVFNWVYNHKDFIRESIESILMQKTTFPVEIIIHDDASNDGTAEVIKEYEAKFPRLFRNILQVDNQWSQGKSVMVPLFEKPRGKYIALTHGDDYWTDPYKLQKQINLLEQYPEASLCVALNEQLITHKNETKKDRLYESIDFPLINHIEDLNQYFHTSTYLIRKSKLDYLSDNYSKLFLGDSGIRFLLISQGPFVVLNEHVSVYRITGEGVWSSLSEYKRELMHYNLFHAFRTQFIKEQFNYHVNLEINSLRRLAEYCKRNNLIKKWLKYRLIYIYLLFKYRHDRVIKQLLGKLK